MRVAYSRYREKSTSCCEKESTSLGSEPRWAGMGRVRLEGGKISGSDSTIAYCGNYVEDGDGFTGFTAMLKTRRHTTGPETLVGTDDVEITLHGSSKGEFGYRSGSIDRITRN